MLDRNQTRRLRHLLAASLVAWLLPGCADLDSAAFTGQHRTQDSEVTLTLTQRIDVGTPLRGANGRPGMTIGYVSAVAASGGDIYIVDQAAGGLLRVDPMLFDATVIARLADPSTHGLYVANSGRVYVVDKAMRAVRQFDRDGTELRPLQDVDLAPAPVDVAESDWGSSIVVADDLTGQLVFFSPLGPTTDVAGIDENRLSVAQRLHALAASGNELFVLDAGAADVSRFDMRGRQTAYYGQDELELPTALTVDDCGRLFVADSSGAGIFVSAFDMRLPPARARQDTPVERNVTDLWWDSGYLYVAAGIDGVAIYSVEPRCGAL